MPPSLGLAGRVGRALGLLRPAAVRCYFVTGTGRCGTMLVARLLSLGANTHCDHERSIRYRKLKPAYVEGDFSSLHVEIDTVLAPEIRRHNRRGRTYGECSGLMYLALPELHRRYGKHARFVLLVRRAQDFAASALARGFFDPEHPRALEHLRPLPGTEMAERWSQASPRERCLWYWAVVNGQVLEFFDTLPSELWRVQSIETLDSAAARSLLDFLDVRGVSEAALRDTLAQRVNASPGVGDEREVNPWSSPLAGTRPPALTEAEQVTYDRWARPLMDRLYPER